VQWDGIGTPGRRFVSRCDVSQDVGTWEGVSARKHARMTQRGKNRTLVVIYLRRPTNIGL
jgi:hypothetical protein